MQLTLGKYAQKETKRTESEQPCPPWTVACGRWGLAGGRGLVAHWRLVHKLPVQAKQQERLLGFPNIKLSSNGLHYSSLQSRTFTAIALLLSQSTGLTACNASPLNNRNTYLYKRVNREDARGLLGLAVETADCLAYGKPQLSSLPNRRACSHFLPLMMHLWLFPRAMMYVHTGFIIFCAC